MFEESVSIPGIWASMNSWFTPTVLFVLLNVMIVAIAVTSRLGAQKHHNQQQKQFTENSPQQNQQQPQLVRSPSVLQRLKSINLYSYTYRSQEPIPIPTPQSHTHQSNLLQTHEFDEPQKGVETESSHDSEEPQKETEPIHEEEEEKAQEGEKTMDEVFSELQGTKFHRAKSDTTPTSGQIPVNLEKIMKKSASAKLGFAHSKEEDVVEARRPVTVREGKAKPTEDDEEEVDAKADDFINRFKQQLKLQRFDSMLRNRETVKKASGK